MDENGALSGAVTVEVGGNPKIVISLKYLADASKKGVFNDVVNDIQIHENTEVASGRDKHAHRKGVAAESGARIKFEIEHAAETGDTAYLDSLKPIDVINREINDYVVDGLDTFTADKLRNRARDVDNWKGEDAVLKAILSNDNKDYLQYLIANTAKVLDEIKANSAHPDQKRAIAMVQKIKEAAQIAFLKLNLEQMAKEMPSAARNVLLSALRSGNIVTIHTALYEVAARMSFEGLAGGNGITIERILEDLLPMSAAELTVISDKRTVPDKPDSLNDFEDAKATEFGQKYTPEMSANTNALLSVYTRTKKEAAKDNKSEGIIEDSASLVGMSAQEIEVYKKILEREASKGAHVVLSIAKEDIERNPHLKILITMEGQKNVKVIVKKRTDLAREVEKVLIAGVKYALIATVEHLGEYAFLEGNIASLILSDGKNMSVMDLAKIADKGLGLEQLAEQLRTGALKPLEIADIGAKTFEDAQEAFKTLGFQA